jgi:UDP-glucose 4-epimerase
VETSLRQLADALLSTMGSDLDVDHQPARTVNAVTRRLADTEAAARDLGFRAEVGLADGLRQLVDWWRVEREVDSELAGTGS